MDYYTILGIERKATLSMIRKAYYKKAKEFHPDTHFYIESETIRKKITELFSYITDAYKTLTDPAERKKYDQGLDITAPHVERNNIETARLKFEEGVNAFKKGSYQDAAELFGQAIYFDSSVPAYHFSLSRAYWKQQKLREAEKAINKAIKFEPHNSDYLAALGHIYLELGLKLRAKSTFEKTIKFDPSNRSALEGLKKI